MIIYFIIILLNTSKEPAPKAIPHVHGKNNKRVPMGFSYLPIE